MTMTKKLTDRQRRFVQEYLVDMNAAAAYRRAGYAAKTAETCGPRMLRFAQVAKAIKKAQDTTAAKIEVTRDAWLAELKIIGFSDIKNHVDIDSDTGSIRAKGIEDMPADSSRAIESITEVRSIHESANGAQTVVNSRVTFRLHSKLEALKQIGEHCGFLKNKVEVGGELGFRVIDHVVKREDAK